MDKINSEHMLNQLEQNFMLVQKQNEEAQHQIRKGKEDAELLSKLTFDL